MSNDPADNGHRKGELFRLQIMCNLVLRLRFQILQPRPPLVEPSSHLRLHDTPEHMRHDVKRAQHITDVARPRPEPSELQLHLQRTEDLVHNHHSPIDLGFLQGLLINERAPLVETQCHLRLRDTTKYMRHGVQRVQHVLDELRP